MSNIHPDIKPNGMNQRDLVNLLYMIVSSIKGICAKLDDDAGVTDTTYEALCYAAIFNTKIDDCRGNSTGQYRAELNFNHITPTGMTEDALLELLYQIFDSFETLCEQLDADGTVNDTTYEANCYTAKFLHMVMNQKGNTLGNGNTFWFKPGRMKNQKELVDCLYNIVDAIETLAEQLDADSGVTDTNYETLWFTDNVLMRIQNSQGNVVGNTSTILG